MRPPYPLLRSRLWTVALTLLLTAGANAQNAPPDPEALRKKMDDLIRQNQELQRQIDELRRQMDQLAPHQPPVAPTPAPSPTPQGSETPGAPAAARQPTPVTETPADALDRALAELQTPSTAPQTGVRSDLLSLKAGSATLRLVDVSLVIDVAAGASTEPDPSIQLLEGGDHDPRRRGFTLQAAELALTGAVDPYFTALANIAYSTDAITGETKVELEEAYAVSQSLPWGLQVKAGQYLTEFGLINPTHPHAWDWLDQPIINSRLFGPDGMRAPGARVAWLMPVPWYSQLIAGVQDNNGEAMASFEANDEFFGERAIGGRPFTEEHVSSLGDMVYALRWENSWELTDTTTVKVGASAAFGPNATGDSARTQMYGADLKIKWRPAVNDRGWPFVIWQSEIMARQYGAAAIVDATDPTNVIDLPADTLNDWGFYSQVLYGFQPRWAVGFRGEYVTGSGDSVGGRDADPFRDDRFRLSPLLVWQLSEFSRLRLQYNYDRADHLPHTDASSLFLGLEVLFGAHPAHSY